MDQHWTFNSQQMVLYCCTYFDGYTTGTNSGTNQSTVAQHKPDLIYYFAGNIWVVEKMMRCWRQKWKEIILIE